jgi:hypothetical protein
MYEPMVESGLDPGVKMSNKYVTNCHAPDAQFDYSSLLSDALVENVGNLEQKM